MSSATLRTHNSHDKLPEHRRAILSIPNEAFFATVKGFLEENKSTWITVKGKSMIPFLDPGDHVLLQPFKGQKIPVGSILLAKIGSSYILHRMVNKKGNSIILAGDGNLSSCEIIPISTIWAIAHWKKNKDGHLQNLNEVRWRISGLIWYHLRPLRSLFQFFNTRFSIIEHQNLKQP
ncbi:S24/S26 family peptidase [Sphingobacterium lactis]|uniref:S24/S26 family peptidase n=1 Tax=Sphingobacterium lactis TaxID=797291 RepID=UPI003DA4CAB2